MKQAGAGTPSANRIMLLRDADGDGVAETRTVFLDGLNSPFGMALVGDDLYVADTDAMLRFPYRDGETRIDGAGREGHRPARRARSTTTGPRTSSPARDGTKLYVTVGSNSNVGENGIDSRSGPRGHLGSRSRDRRASRLRLRPAQPQRHGAGSRRPARCGPSVNERDELGSDLVPDYMTSVRDGGFYGWPYSYYGQHVDDRVQAAAARPRRQGDRARLCARRAHRLAGPRVLRPAQRLPAHFARRHVHRPARLVEPQAARAATR